MTRKARNRGKRIAAPDGTVEIAVSLARAGWPVFPVTIYEDDDGKRHKIPAVKWKDRASTKPKDVRAMWAEFPGRWIGVYAGAAGIITLDLDPKRPGRKAGDRSLAKAGLDVPVTPINYPTPSGGHHFVYAAPEGVELTIAQDLTIGGVKLEGVDVRSGAGLMIYYGPALDGPPVLPPAPDWLLVSAKKKGDGSSGDAGALADPSATEVEYTARLVPGKAPKSLRKTIRAVDFPSGAAHEPMLETVAALVSEGSKGVPGVADLIAETRERYVGSHPDRGRDWDNAISGSVRRFGYPLRSFPLSKSERAAVEKNNAPERVEKRKREKRARLVAAHIEDGDDLSDDALAEHVARRFGDVWTCVTGTGLLRYDGRVWAAKDRAVLVDDVRELLREIRIVVTELAIRRGDAKLEAAARALGARAKIAAVSDLAAGIMLAHEPELDGDRDSLNVRNGVIDLRSGELRPHAASDYFTRCAPVDYDPDADDAMWRRALEALPAKVAEWLRVRLGQASTGHRPDDDVLVFLQGAGSNGKSTILDGVRATLGDALDGGYAATVSDQLLLASPDAHPTTLMSLRGARAAFFEELPEGRSLNVKRLKDTVGTSRITARRMRQDETTFSATHALFGSTNYMPVVAETDHGTWRRLALCAFTTRYVDDESEIETPRDRVADPAVRDHFEAGADPAVLTWLVSGARDWYAAGRSLRKAARMPKRVRQDTRAWRMDADPVLGYVAERIVRSEEHAITAKDLADDFNAWIERRGHHAWTQTTINSRFGGHSTFAGIERGRVRFGHGISPSRPATTFGIATRPIPPNTQAWQGVRFADDDDQRDAATLADMEEGMKR